jgi:proline iminopeptidase
MPTWLHHLWSDWRIGLLAVAGIAAGAALFCGWLIPRGPITTPQALASIAGGLLIGVAAGLILGSRWSLIVAPLGFVVVYELVRLGVSGPTVDAIQLGSLYGAIAFVVGRFMHGIFFLAPMMLGAIYGIWLAACLGKADTYVMAAPGWVVSIAASLALVWLAISTARAAVTHPILGADGAPLPDSIAELVTLPIGGHAQAMMVRGRSIDAPVLLYLAGGPGGTDFGAMRLDAGLEQSFVVAVWDQRGAGKSYSALDPAETLTLEQMVADTLEVTNYLRQRFDEEKIYVVGNSWGATLGVLAVQRRPELYHAFVGTGQMVSQRETDIMFYEDTLTWAKQTGNHALADLLRRNGPPPYDNLLDYEPALAHEHNWNAYPELDTNKEMPAILFVPEYSLMDRVNGFRAFLDTFSVLYPQLQEIDFRQDVPELDIPVYIVSGAHEARGRAVLAKQWFALLEAPSKEMFIFEHSGHRPLFEEPAKFVAVMEKVLEETHSAALPPGTAPRSAASAQPPSDQLPARALSDDGAIEAFFDDLLPRQLAKHHIAGAAVAMVKDGQVRFARGYGYANIATQRPVDAERTLFRTDSTGKLFVWTAVMQLAERGKLDLGADVNAYLDFTIPATFAQPITLRHLLSHSAGFEDQGYMFALKEEDLQTPGAFLARHMPARIWEPGQYSGYSNYGTALAGYIVERVAGQSFEEYVAERIFAPLNMTRSTFLQPLPSVLANQATENYQHVDGKFNARPFVFLQTPSAGEGHTTVIDMASFMLAHLSEGDTPILSAETMAQMHSRLFSHLPEVNGFAYGFAETTSNGRRILRHEGNNPGVSSTALFLAPEDRLGVYVAYNSNGGFEPGEELRRAFFDHFFPVTAQLPARVQLSDAERARLEGSYRSTRMFHTTFGKVVRLFGGNFADVTVRANADGTFTTQGIGASPLTWVAVAPLVLRPVDGANNAQGDLRFATDDAGQVTALFVENNPYRAFEKTPWHETIPFQQGVGVAWLVGFLSILVGAPLVWLVGKRWPALLGANGLAWGLLAAACALGLLFLLGLLLTAEPSLLYGVTPAFLAVLALPLIALALAGASVVVTALTWQNGGWAPIPLAFYGIGVAAMAVFAWWLHYWNLLGWRV